MAGSQTKKNTGERGSVAETISDRQKKYGHPSEHFQRTVGILNAMGYRREAPNGAPMKLSPDDWPRIMIADKLARSQENRSYGENFHDIQGYARCWEMLGVAET